MGLKRRRELNKNVGLEVSLMRIHREERDFKFV